MVYSVLFALSCVTSTLASIDLRYTGFRTLAGLASGLDKRQSFELCDPVNVPSCGTYRDSHPTTALAAVANTKAVPFQVLDRKSCFRIVTNHGTRNHTELNFYRLDVLTVASLH